MYPFVWDAGERPRRVWTYQDFQSITLSQRDKALKWLKGRTRLGQYFDDYQRATQAANDDDIDDIKGLLVVPELVMMLYCWEECGRDEVLAKMTYVDGRKYGPSA